MVTPPQIRAARGLLGLSQVWLAKLAAISPTALVNIETGSSDPKARDHQGGRAPSSRTEISRSFACGRMAPLQP